MDDDLSRCLDKLGPYLTTTDINNEVINEEVIVSKIRKTYKKNVLIKVEHFDKFDRRHRDYDKAAVLEYTDEGNIFIEKYYQYGKKHRSLDKPAYISYADDGGVGSKRWYYEGKKHREGGNPALINFTDDGCVELRIWYQDDKEHRDGNMPSFIKYCNGKIVKQNFCRYGHDYLPNIPNDPIIDLVSDLSIREKEQVAEFIDRLKSKRNL